MACLCHTCFHGGLLSLQVCVPLIQSTLILDSSAALPGTPARAPANQSLALATPAPKSGMNLQTCLQLDSRCSKSSVLLDVFMPFHLQYVLIESVHWRAQR